MSPTIGEAVYNNKSSHFYLYGDFKNVNKFKIAKVEFEMPTFKRHFRIDLKLRTRSLFAK